MVSFWPVKLENKWILQFKASALTWMYRKLQSDRKQWKITIKIFSAKRKEEKTRLASKKINKTFIRPQMLCLMWSLSIQFYSQSPTRWADFLTMQKSTLVIWVQTPPSKKLKMPSGTTDHWEVFGLQEIHQASLSLNLKMHGELKSGKKFKFANWR